MVNLEWLKSCSQTRFYQLVLAVVIWVVAYLGVYGLPNASLNMPFSTSSGLDDGAAQQSNVSGVMA
jgi:hypothetical protein